MSALELLQREPGCSHDLNSMALSHGHCYGCQAVREQKKYWEGEKAGREVTEEWALKMLEGCGLEYTMDDLREKLSRRNKTS